MLNQSRSAMQYQIFVQNPAERKFKASVVGLHSCIAEGQTKEEAIAGVQIVLEEQLAQGEFVTLNLPPLTSPSSETSQAEHPWMKFAGMWAEDPQFDEFVAEMKRERELED
jgi:predicted RNase H-like HicB family nuclease